MTSEVVQSIFQRPTTIFDRIDEIAIEWLQLPLDQALYFVNNFLSIPLAFVLQWILPASRVGENVRHLYSFLIGLLFCVISFRWNVLNVVIPTVVSYPLMKYYVRADSLGRTTAAIAMIYLAGHHIYRLTLVYGIDFMDCSVVLMIWTQKITLLAWSIRDGQLPESELSEESHKKARVTEFPSFLAHISYLLGFLGYQTIPGYSFKEYDNFIKGKHLVPFREQRITSDNQEVEEEKYPSPNWMVLTHLPLALAYGYALRMLAPYFQLRFMAGQLPESELSEESHKKARVTEFPSFLAHISYLLGFLGYQTIPGYSFKEYDNFIKGKHLVPFREQMITSDNQEVEEEKYPSPNWMVLTHLPLALAYGYALRMLAPYFQLRFMADDRFIAATSFAFKVMYGVLCGFVLRLRYYFAWKLGQSICYAAGFGFSGWTEDGKERWELVRNGELTKVERCSNWKELLDEWNNMTSKWLRFICYSRIQNKKAAIGLTFFFSSLWHGFHPGYYIHFIHAYLFVLAGRKIRKCIRPQFQVSSFKKNLYNCVTWMGLQLSMSYAIMGFNVLQMWTIFVIYRSMYFHCTLVAVFLLVVLIPKNQDNSATNGGQIQNASPQRGVRDSRKKK
ncbi:lysophospholipid acyltransferase 1-like [Symsagittifera roscoffensis]|uniref:lysophospholipid acyltransferase 1-like n=1 Tax=Symsagittifera roscoffensis TaxID=84072 RepID=UPI00307C8D03